MLVVGLTILGLVENQATLSDMCMQTFNGLLANATRHFLTIQVIPTNKDNS